MRAARLLLPLSVAVLTMLLLLLAMTTPTTAFTTTSPPPTKPKPSPTDPPPKFFSFLPKIRNGTKRVYTRAFAQLPDFGGRPSRIVGMTAFGNALYVTASTSGTHVYKVTMKGQVSLWFNLQEAVLASTGRNVDCVNSKHGGIRGIAFPPDFLTTGLFYVSFLEEKPRGPWRVRYFSGRFLRGTPDSVVAEFKYSFKGKTVLPLSYRQVIRIGNPAYDHPIKQIAFDGNFLLIGHGDGSKGSKPENGGMDNDGLGKIIRINPKQKGRKPYTIPWTNPWRKRGPYKDELYAVGLRNPHNICVSPRHGIFVTDAGRDNVEEVNIIEAGGNYGWKEREGTFVHDDAGGTVTGIRELPRDDAKFGYIYPNVQVPHFAPRGQEIFGQALAGGCPIETQSPLKGLFLYANFAADGQLYYSWVGAMKRAVTKGRPTELKQATIYLPKIYFDHDGDRRTPPLVLDTLREVVQNDGSPRSSRVDMRFGRGPQGQIFWSSKVTGKIYLITSSVEGARR